MLFAGDTAGRISCWDVTTLLLNHVKEYCDFIRGEYRLMKNVSDRESANQVAVEKRTVCEEDTSEKSILEGNIYLEKYDTSLKSVTPRHVKESVTTDSVIKNQDKSENESISNPEGCVTDTAESEKCAVIDHLTVKQDVTNRNEQTAITSETPDPTSLSLNDRDDEECNAEFVEQSDFSCLPLVQVFLQVPTHVFQAHQSGVNAISLVKSQGKTEWNHLFYLVVLVFY